MQHPDKQEKIIFCLKFGTYFTSAIRDYQCGMICKKCEKSNLEVYIGTDTCILCLPCAQFLSDPSRKVILLHKDAEKSDLRSNHPVIHEQIRCFIAPPF